MKTFNTLIVVIALFLYLPQTKANEGEIIKVITKFVALQKQPTKVVSFLCWKNENILRLTKSISQENIMISTNFDFSIQKNLLPTIHPEEHQLYVLDADCTFSEYILQTACRTRLLEPPYRWLILDECNYSHNLDVYLNTRIYILRKCDYRIVSVYKHSLDDSFMYNDVASWNGKHFTHYNEISDVRNRSDLVGTPMNISMVIRYKESLEHLTDFRDTEHDALSKYNYILASYVVDSLNATAIFIPRDTWGYLDTKTMTYDGMYGDVQTKISEIGATPSYYTTHRRTFVDFISETTPTYGKFIFRSPPLSAVSNVFYLPFNYFVWWACIGLLIIIFWVVYIIIKWEWSSELFQNVVVGPNKTAVLRPGIMEVVQMEIGAVCQQGTEAEPRSGSGRIATFFIFLTLMFLYVSYSANIVALLQSTTDSIKTLDDLYESKMEMACENITYLRFFIKMTKGETQKLIRETRLSIPNKPENYVPATEGVEKLRSGYYAFFAEVDTIYKIVSKTFLEHEKCGLNEIGYWNLPNPVVFMKKNSTYKELVKIAYTKIHERGMRMRNFKLLYDTKPTCKNQGANFTSVSINDCYFAILSFGIGIGVSLVVFVLELGSKRVRKINTIASNIIK